MEAVASDFSHKGNPFVALHDEYLKARTEENAMRIMENLRAVDFDSIDSLLWLDCEDLLKLLLNDVSPSTLLNKGQLMLLQVLAVGAPSVVSLLAEAILKMPEHEQLLEKSAPAVIIAFARRICDVEDCDMIAKLVAPFAPQDLVLQELMHQLNSAVGPRNSQHRFRIYQILYRVFCRGSFEKSLEPVLLRAIEEITEDKDVLCQLTSIELFGDIALTGESSACALQDYGVSQKIHDLLVQSRTSPDGFLFPACARFFGNLLRRYPQALESYSSFVNVSVDMVCHFDLLDATQRALAFDIFANIAYPASSKEYLVHFLEPEKVQSVMQAYGAAINSGPVDLRKRHVQAASILFGEGDERMCSSWFSAFGDPFPSLVLLALKKPFEDVKAIHFEFLLTVFQYPTIILMFIRTAGFNEWLLNPETESVFESIEAKKSVVRRILDVAAQDPSFIDAPFVDNLKAYLLPRREAPTVDVAL